MRRGAALKSMWHTRHRPTRERPQRLFCAPAAMADFIMAALADGMIGDALVFGGR